MPAYTHSPKFAISCRLDARPWVGATTQLYSRVTLATGLEVAVGNAYVGVVHYDILSFLTERAIFESWGDNMNTQYVTGDFTSGIDENDQVWIENATTDFEIPGSVLNVSWGYPVTHTGLVGGVAPFRQTAPNQWLRGNLDEDARIAVRIGATTKYWPSLRGATQDVPTSLVSQGTNPASLESVDDLAFGAEHRWGVDAAGHVYSDTPNALYNTSADATIVWIDTDLRDRLGFTGNEVIAVGSNRRRLTAELPCPGLITPSRPVRRSQRGAMSDGTSTRLTEGTAYHVAVNTAETMVIDWSLDGAADLVDMHWQWLSTCIPLLTDGAPFVIYQQWGDSRLVGKASLGETYSALLNVEDGGFRGRVNCYADGHQASPLPSGGNLKRRYPVTTRCVVRP